MGLFAPLLIFLASLTPIPRASLDPLWGVGFDDTLASPGLGPALASVSPNPAPWTHPIHVRLLVSRAELDFSALDARLAQYRAIAGVDVYLDIRTGGVAPTATQIESWNRFLRELAAHAGSGVRGYVIGADWAAAGAAAPAAELAFVVKDTAVTLRAVRADAAIVVAGLDAAPAPWLEAFYDADVAPYIDAIALGPEGPALGTIAPIVDRRDASCAIVLVGASLGDAPTSAPASAPQQFTARQLQILGTRVSGVTYAATAQAVAAVLPTVAFLRDLIDQPLERLDEGSVALSLRSSAGGVNAAGTEHRLLFGLSSAASYLVYSGGGQPLSLSINESAGTKPVIRDAPTQARRQPDNFAFDAATKRETMRLPAANWPLVVDWSGDSQVHIERTGTSSSVLPSVAEVIARHQQAQVSQDALVASYIADATMSAHFRPTAGDSGWDVVTTDRYFIQGQETEFEELTFRVNGISWGANHPPFPLLQPEKVLSLPLELRLTTDYRYTLDGTDRVNGRDCFVVHFTPVRADASLYKGTVWIDRDTYLKLKVSTIQTNLGAPVLSSEEILRFDRAGAVNGRDVFMLAEVTIRQNILMAGHSIPFERHVELRDFQINPPDFDARRQTARASNHVMFRETDHGLRYLILKDGQRVVDEGITASVKALLLGINVDPSFDYPLPLGGLNYIDFQFLGTKDSQLAMIFAGVLALVNIQRPHLIGDRVDGSFDLFAIAVPSSDRTYDPTGERPGERVLTIPFNTGLNLGWRITERTRLTAQYEFHYDWYGHDTTTAATFQIPSSTITNAIGVGAEWRRGGYALAANWSTHVRSRWEAWGNDPFDSSTKQYTRQSIGLTKDILWGIQKLHLNAAYYGGRNLDRFSQYQFGFFDEHKIHGVPSSGVRFSELGMFRATYGFNLFEQYRAEISLDHAYGRDPLISTDWHRITGVGVGFLLRGPFKTMIRGDVGKSFLPDRYRNPGSLVFQFQILKPL